MSFAGVLPFLAALKKQTPDFSGMESEGIPTPPDPGAQPPPDLSAGMPAQPPQGQPDPNLSNVGTQTQDERAPKFQETKGHLLMRLLQGGLQGGLNGLAANAQTYAQTGRNAGFGGGFAGAEQMPFLQAQRAQQLQMGQAQINLLKQQAQEINVPGYGSMPAGLAKVLFPSLIGAGAKVKAADIGAQGRIGAAEVGKSVVVVPGKGLYQRDQQGNYQPVQGAQMPNVLVTADEAQSLGHPELANQELPMDKYSSLLRGVSSQYALGSGTAGPAVINKRGVAQGVPGSAVSAGLGAPSLAAPREIADTDNPGQTKIVSGGTAIATGAAGPNSASVAVPRAAAKAEVPTKIGDLRIAFTTMDQHAQLLRQAAAALNNGDVQALAGLKNSFKNAFGYSGPITAEAIADAYKGEVSNVINKGHITDAGNERVAHTLDPAHQNYQTIDSVLGAYQALAQSKLNMLNQQKQNAINQSQPNSGNRNTASAQPNQPKQRVQLGQTVTIGGKTMKVTSVHADGSFDAQ